MKVLVFGVTGQVAREIQRRAGETAIEAYGSSHANFENPEHCAALVEESGADAVINAAAYTAVDKSESEEALATAVNGVAPGYLARSAAERGLPFVHLSTDYVFDGSGDVPWSVDSPTAPLGAYGRSKLAGELAVRGAGGTHAIVRTSWVVSSHGGNFVKTMLRLAGERETLNIVADQVGGPTPAAAIADTCLRIASALTTAPEKSGTYHFSGTPDVSWADFAREIIRLARLDCTVTDIPTSAYPTPAQRPLNSRLDNSLTETNFGIARPEWRLGLADILTDLGALTT